jgi:hypothetical protein
VQAEEFPSHAKKQFLTVLRAPYTHVSFTRSLVENFSYVTAEVQLKNRLHRRILAADPEYKSTYGKPLFYADSYLSGDDPETFIYARHTCLPAAFFEQLSHFLTGIAAENPELRGKNYPLLLANGNDSRIEEVPIPFEIKEAAVQQVSFSRLDLPIGAMTIEFLEEKREGQDQLTSLSSSGELPQQLDAPLVGFDFTDGSLYTPLLLAVHWAADQVPHSVLEAALGEITPSSVPA